MDIKDMSEKVDCKIKMIGARNKKWPNCKPRVTGEQGTTNCEPKVMDTRDKARLRDSSSTEVENKIKTGNSTVRTRKISRMTLPYYTYITSQVFNAGKKRATLN